MEAAGHLRNSGRATISALAMLAASLSCGGVVHAAEGDAAVIASAPAGFADLLGEQEAMLDVYMGGVRVTEARARFSADGFRFADARSLVEALPGIADDAAVAAALGGEMLATHPDKLCRGLRPEPGCGKLAPETAGIIFDRDRYRVDLFVNPALLTVQAATARQHLPRPQPGFTLIDGVTAAVAGTTGGRVTQENTYYVRNDAILGFGTGRLRASFSQSSESGLLGEVLAAELDRPGVRYTAGSFWVPGNEILGRRRILGAGFGSQFDTRLDRDQFEGSPLIAFLDERSRVDILVDGHLMASKLYDAGNQALDTASLPEGSYEVELRVIAPSGLARSERRFFTRNRSLPPVGHDSFMAYAGVLVQNNRGFLGNVGDMPLVQLGWARRVSPRMAVRTGIMATDNKQWGETGVTLLDDALRVEAAGMASLDGDVGGFVHVSSQGQGRLSFDINARAVDSDGNEPLLGDQQPISVGPGDATYSLPTGGYSQISGNVSYAFGGGRVALVGNYRGQAGERSYAFGPALYLPVLRSRNFDLIANGDFAETELGQRGYVGLSLRLNAGRTQFAAETAARLVPRGDRESTEAAARITALHRVDDLLGAQVQAQGSVDHDSDATYMSGQLEARHRLAQMNASLLQPLAGNRDTTQYAGTFHTNLVARDGYVGMTSAINGDSMVVARVKGAAPGDNFDVMVNDVPLATISGQRSVAFAVPSYRAYDVRLRPRGAQMADYDTSTQSIGLYPGSVAGFTWRLEPVVAVYGRLVTPDGAPIRLADVLAGNEIAETDNEGRFMIQIGAVHTLFVRGTGDLACAAQVKLPPVVTSYLAAGDLICMPTVREQP